MRERQCDKDGLFQLISSMGKSNMVILEIGSYSGESAELFLQTGKVSSITCIDPWQTIIEKEGGNTYTNMDKIESEYDRRMLRYAGKFTKFKGTIDTYVSQYSGKPEYDMAYIDGLHTYEGCINDINKVIRFIKPKIAIAGHDYADAPHHIIGVKRAVNEVFGNPDLTFCDTSWVKFMV